MNSRGNTEVGKSSEEIHRMNQRRQYKLMLAGLDDLAKVLPAVVESDRRSSKQSLLTEGIHYIHYLQLCIYQLGMDTTTDDKDILFHIHWDIPHAEPCCCVKKIEEEIKRASSASQANDAQQRSSMGETDELTPKKCSLAREAKTPTSNLINKKNRKSSTPTKLQNSSLSFCTRNITGKSSRRKCDKSPKIDSERVLQLSPVKSFGRAAKRTRGRSSDVKRVEFLSKSLPLLSSTGEKKKKNSQEIDQYVHKSPARGPPCEIISPPSSYKRTIIQDSPLDNSMTHDWEKVSVRNCSGPWMPKPENACSNIEEIAENSVSHYAADGQNQDEMDVSEHFLSSSMPPNSFLDTTYSDDDENVPMSSFRVTELDTTRAELYNARTRTAASVLSHLSDQRRPMIASVKPPEVYKMGRTSASRNAPPSPGLVGFSPGIFLTGRRFDTVL